MSQANTKPVSAQVLDAAIAWQLCLDCGNGSAVEQAEFAKWYSASEEHARAWLQLGMLDQRFSNTGIPARNALLNARNGVQQRVRKLGSGLASVALVCGLALFAGKSYLPIDYWMADQRTATGEQRQLRLADGTLLNLNTHSAVDVQFDDSTRRIVLQEGEIMVETGHGDPRPFIVQTRDGSLLALGTRFMVKREDDGTRLSVLQSRVQAHPQDSGEQTIYSEGQQVLMHHDRLGQMYAVSPGADAWTRGMLVLDNVRLADMVGELNRYQRGHLGVAPEVADLRITGSFPLNNVELALNALLPTLPVEIRQRTPWWVTVSAKPAAN
ncbi:FecR family protein [Pseudomonas fragi]|uniref:FecR family protein n=1 Tax=Pseudomonas fragi TaxID=296 RepID=UPI00193B16F5|nr:FecR family protein [Pseudomonas fragi]MBM1204388.1 FecR family protein [Pseudomonas fragi]